MLPFLLLLSYAQADELCTDCDVPFMKRCENGTVTRRAFIAPNGSVILPSTIRTTQVVKTTGLLNAYHCMTGSSRDMRCEVACLGQREDRGPSGRSHHHLFSCGLSVNCTCQQQNVSTTWQTFDHFNIVNINSTTCRFGVLDSPKGWVSPFEHRKRDASSAFVVDYGNVIGIMLSPPSSFIMRVSCNDWSIVQSINSTDQYNYTLPQGLMLGGGDVLIEVWNTNGLIARKTISITVPDRCTVVNSCVVCVEVFDNWKCVPSSLKYLMFMMGLVLLVVFASLIPAAIYVLGFLISVIIMLAKFSWKLVTQAHRTRMAKYFGQKAGTVKDMVGSALEVDEMEAQVGPVRVRGRAPSIKEALMMAMMLASAHACDNAVTGVFNLVDCVDNGSSKNCAVSFNVQLNFGSVGTTSCMAIQAPELTSPLNLEITWEAQTVRGIPVLQYFSSDWEGQSFSTEVCPATTHCSASGQCDPVMAGDTSLDSMISGVYVGNPGISTCDSGSADLGGCFLQTGTCIYSRYTLKPTLFSFPVYLISEYYTWYTFRAVLSGPDGVVFDREFEVQQLDTSLPFVYNGQNYGFNFKLNGQFVSQDTSLDKIGYVLVANNAARIAASPAGNPTKGLIGDIQSLQPIPLGVAASDAFIFDTSMITKSVSGLSTTYSFAMSGLQNQIHQPLFQPFPLHLGADIWEAEENHPGSCDYIDACEFHVQTNTTTGGALSIGFKTNTPLNITQTISVVCPQITSSIMSGCYNCIQKPQVELKLKSTCAAGTVLFRSTNDNVGLLKSNAQIGTTESTVIINFITTNQEVAFDVCAQGSGGEVCSPVVGTLTATNMTLGDTSNRTDGTMMVFDASSSTDLDLAKAFNDVFSGLGSWWQYLEVIGVLLACIVVAALLIYGVFMLWRWYKTYKMTDPKTIMELFAAAKKQQ